MPNPSGYDKSIGKRGEVGVKGRGKWEGKRKGKEILSSWHNLR